MVLKTGVTRVLFTRLLLLTSSDAIGLCIGVATLSGVLRKDRTEAILSMFQDAIGDGQRGGDDGV